MPNHVYNRLTVSDKDVAKLEKIAEVGLCQFFHPMPKEVEETTAPMRDEEMKAFMMEKYGVEDWYYWALKFWGTKWGAYENSMDGNTYHFTTAWSTPNQAILDAFIEMFPNCEYRWEEEQGYGKYVRFENGDVVEFIEWDIPEFEEYEHIAHNGRKLYFYELLKEHTTDEKTYPKGYYYEGNLEEYLGATLDKAEEQHDLFYI